MEIFFIVNQKSTIGRGAKIFIHSTFIFQIYLILLYRNAKKQRKNILTDPKSKKRTLHPTNQVAFSIRTET